MITKESTILVTGATGFIGSYVLRQLEAEGYTKLRALHRPGSPTDLVESVQLNIDWREGDLLDFHSLEEAIQGVDAIIHTAAMVSFHGSDRTDLMEVNVEGTRHLVNLAIHYQLKKFIHISSVAALGRKLEHNIISEDTEWQSSVFNSNYAKSKQLAEMEVWRAFAEGLSVAILNPANVLGAGFWDQGTPRTFRQIAGGFRYYTEGMTGYVDVRDVARLSVRLLQLPIEGRRFIASENDYTYQEVFQLIAKALDAPAPSIRVKSWMIPFARMSDWIKSRIKGRRPFLSREIVRNSRMRWQYLNDRSKEELGFDYTPIQQTIMETGAAYKKSMENGQKAAVLPL